MIEGVWLWVSFALIALATHIPRGSFIVAGSRVRLPSTLQRALRYAPAAALSALVLPDVVLDTGVRQLPPQNDDFRGVASSISKGFQAISPNMLVGARL